MACKPGELVLIPFPFSDLQSKKKRPVMVLTPPDRHADFIGLALTTVEQQHHALQVGRVDLLEGVFPQTLLDQIGQDLFPFREQHHQDIRQPFSTDDATRVNRALRCRGIYSGLSESQPLRFLPLSLIVPSTRANHPRIPQKFPSYVNLRYQRWRQLSYPGYQDY